MFGYLKCDETKLSPKERDLIGAFYCGLCMALKKHFGNKSRMFTNMDCTYASMLIVSINNEEIDLQPKRCFLHPFSKRNISYFHDELSKKICSATILISYYKLLDDCKDEKRNFTKKTMRVVFKNLFKKAKNILPDYNEKLSILLKKTQKLELENNNSLFELMDVSGEILKEMAISCDATQLQNLFFHIGRYIYFIDALDDYESDIKRNRYNALVNYFGNHSTNKQLFLSKQKHIDNIFDEIYSSINNEYEALKSYEETNNIFDNLFTLGIKKCYLDIINKK